MSNLVLAKSYTAEGAIGQYRIAKVGAADGGALQATAVSESLIGVCITPGGGATGDRVDIQTDGVAEVEAGGVVARGAPVTTDASGKGVAAAPAAGTNNRIIGFAEVTAASGDIFRVKLAPSTFQG